MVIKHKHPVSVIVPVHNCERYLKDALESILAQICCPMEVIVVDDGSTDKSAEIANRFGPPVHTFSMEHSGAGAARNYGVAQAKGELFAFLDSDDLWAEDKIERQLAAFENHPGIDVVSGHVRQFRSPELPVHSMNKIKCPEESIPGHVVGAMLIKREAFFRVGLFETDLQVGEVMSWYIRAFDMNIKMLMLPECVYLRRLHESNKGITHREFIKQRVRILKAHLDRKGVNAT